MYKEYRIQHSGCIVKPMSAGSKFHSPASRVTLSAIMRTITLEEHFATLAFLEGPGRQLNESANIPGSPIAGLPDKLFDIGKRRIAEMDAADISVQVLSLTFPGVEQLEAFEAITIARETNDDLVTAVRKYPSRLAGFATLPTAAPEQAVVELERTV